MVSARCCPKDSVPPMKALKESERKSSMKGKIISIPIDMNQKKKYFSSTSKQMKVYCTGQCDFSLTQRIVIVFSDVFGYDSGRHFQFADNLASLLNIENIDGDTMEGLKTTIFIPDLFLGKPIIKHSEFWGDILSIIMNLPKSIYRLRNCESELKGLKNIFLPWVQSQFPMIRMKDDHSSFISLSCVGFCFGGWMVSKCLSSIDSLIYKKENEDLSKCKIQWNCGVGIHPSLNVELLYRQGTKEEDIALSMAKKKQHFLSLTAKNDSKKMKENGSVIKILANVHNVNHNEIAYTYEDMSHGFCSRGDESDRKIKAAIQSAEKKAADFISKHHKI